MAGKGNYKPGHGPAPASASVPRQRLDGPKKEDPPEGEKQPLIKFSRALWAEIMALLCEGYTVGDICNQPGMPSERSREAVINSATGTMCGLAGGMLGVKWTVDHYQKHWGGGWSGHHRSSKWDD